MEGWRWYIDKDIWEDNWISGSHNFKIQMTRGNNLVLTVDELINLVNSTWDVDLATTGYSSFAECQGHSAKPQKHSAKST